MITEMVPQGAQSANDWTEMVTVQVFLGLKQPPAVFKNNIAQLWKKACPDSTAGDVWQGKENGYPAELSAPGLSVEFADRQAGDHLVQGDPGRRQLLRRAEGLQVHAGERSDHALDQLPEQGIRLRFPPARPGLSEGQPARALNSAYK